MTKILTAFVLLTFSSSVLADERDFHAFPTDKPIGAFVISGMIEVNMSDGSTFTYAVEDGVYMNAAAKNVMELSMQQSNRLRKAQSALIDALKGENQRLETRIKAEPFVVASVAAVVLFATLLGTYVITSEALRASPAQ